MSNDNEVTDETATIISTTTTSSSPPSTSSSPPMEHTDDKPLSTATTDKDNTEQQQQQLGGSGEATQPSTSSSTSSSASSSLSEEETTVVPAENGVTASSVDGTDGCTIAVRAPVGDDSEGNGVLDESQPQQQQQQQEAEEQSTTQMELLQQQIKSLTLERDSALSQLHDQKNIPTEPQLQQNEQQHLLLTELQSKLQTQTTQKAELEHTYHTLQTQHTTHLQKYSTLEDQVEQHKASILQITISKTSIENEVSTLRTARDTHERTQMVLHNRLNDAKKKEAQRSTVASRLQVENTTLTEELAGKVLELKRMTTAKERLEGSLEKLKRKVVERVKSSDAALVEERNLNEERKRKMKAFVEHKAEELKGATILNDELRAELVETNGALTNVRNKVESVGEECTRVQNRNRDLVREVTRMKKNSEHLHQMGDNLELELHKSTQETEEHKSKRQTAKHEMMSMLRKLEAEQAVSTRLRDSVKFTFTPKALSQQQLLTESLQDFEANLFKLSRRLGKPLPPSPILEADGNDSGGGAENGGTVGEAEASSRRGSGSATGTAGGGGSKNGKMKRGSSLSELDTSRLLSNLECETQSVSKCIMALGGAVERLHVILDDSGDKSCVSTINKIFFAISEGKEDVPQGGDGRSGASAGVGATGSRTNFERHGLVQSQNR